MKEFKMHLSFICPDDNVTS